jgi:hypothetical protein
MTASSSISKCRCGSGLWLAHRDPISSSQPLSVRGMVQASRLP